MNAMGKLILQVIDFFYPLFRKIMPIQTFRYAACGGFNTLLDIFIFFVCYNYVFRKQLVHIGSVVMTPHIASLLTSFILTFPIGFYLSSQVVFSSSVLRGRVQLFRYFLLVMACIALNYTFIKIFVEQLHIYPTISKIMTTAIVVTFSYFTQKHFTFKSKTGAATKTIKIHLPE